MALETKGIVPIKTHEPSTLYDANSVIGLPKSFAIADLPLLSELRTTFLPTFHSLSCKRTTEALTQLIGIEIAIRANPLVALPEALPHVLRT